MKLSQNNLKLLPAEVEKPLYERRGLKPAIVHIGVGGFHRAHQAFYLDELLNKGLTDWAICGMGVRQADESIYKALKEQDYLYTLLVKHPDGAIRSRIIGAMVDYVFAPENPAVAVARLADEQTKIVSLTITEGGYNFDQNGDFIFDNPDIQRDIHHPEAPKTVFGLFACALKTRYLQGIKPFTVLSCDNIQRNGDVMRKMLLSFTERFDKSLADRIRTDVSFPNSMVDRITPVTMLQDIELLQETTGIEDACPVTCEPFIQWVLEDRFSAGRPVWEQVGVQFVKDIDPYEKMKLRLLNAGHSFLGFTGSLLGYQTIDEAVNNPLICKCLRAFMDKEVTPLLGLIKGVDLDDYKDTLMERFRNPNIRDQLTRICSESSVKLPKFLIPTVKEQLERKGPIHYAVIALAAWRRTLELYAAGKYDYPIQDVMLGELTQAAVHDNPVTFLHLEAIFCDLAQNPRFVDEFINTSKHIRELGIEKTFIQLITNKTI
ncbi:mannitol 2-dehydrogenase [Bacteroidia bacterium]|nr:mannitol 2-dehydrogenase [Bacteroidia bacterium]